MFTRRRVGLCAGLLLCVASAVAQDEADGARQEIDANAQAALENLFMEVDTARDLYERAAGYAAFAATKAGGFFVTGGTGRGVAVDKVNGHRTYMRLGTGGVGLGLGAQQYELVILFEDLAHLNRFVEGGWDAAASAQAAAGTDGIAYSSSFVDGVALYQITARGLMAQADVSGTRFWPIDDLNP